VWLIDETLLQPSFLMPGRRLANRSEADICELEVAPNDKNRWKLPYGIDHLPSARTALDHGICDGAGCTRATETAAVAAQRKDPESGS
jgi:hypothetical protein